MALFRKLESDKKALGIALTTERWKVKKADHDAKDLRRQLKATERKLQAANLTIEALQARVKELEGGGNDPVQQVGMRFQGGVLDKVTPVKNFAS